MAYVPGGVQPIILVKEDLARTRGKDAMRSNILAVVALADIIKTALGPAGRDKMLVDRYGNVIVTNDGATILKEMDIAHPAAKYVVELAKSQEAEVGDGTTTVVVIAGELLRQAEKLLDTNLHPSIIVEGYRMAMEKAIEELEKLAEEVNPEDEELLKKIVNTTLSSKLAPSDREHITNIVVQAAKLVMHKVNGERRLDKEDIKIEKKEGGSIRDTMLVRGIVLDKEVVHPDMPRRVENAKIALINAPLEMRKPEISGKIRFTDPRQIEEFKKAEREIVKRKIEAIIKAGANVVFCQKGIDEYAQHLLAKHGILAVRRVKKSDMEALAKATGAKIITKPEEITPEDLGEAELVEERKVGDDKMVFVEGCKHPRAVTILIRGGSKQVVDEVERAIDDAISVIRDVIKHKYVVYGGGAIEAELAKRIREYAKSISGKEQVAIEMYADALEVIPSVLADNVGINPIDAITELRSRHAKGETRAGVSIEGKIDDMKKLGVVEPMIVKRNAIRAASEAAMMILRIDDILASKPKEEGESKMPK